MSNNNDNEVRGEDKLFNECRSVFEFERLNYIDEGTFGTVYRAKDKKTNEIVALKKVHMKSESKVEGFPLTSLRETSILMAVDHPNIVNVKEVVVDPKVLDNVYVVMEFLEHDMKDLMENMQGPFLASEVKCLLLQLLKGVKYMHENWYIHRDLKTSNLLMNNKGILKICDFGLAREYGSPQFPLTPGVCTLWYRAPELLLGSKDYTTAIDMWSVGCIFAEFILKEPLLQGRNEISQIKKIFDLLGVPNEESWPTLNELPHYSQFNFNINQPYNKLRNKVPNLTNNAFDLLNKMLCHDPNQRITAEEALNHPYFSESPPAQHPSLMPTFPSRNETGKKRKRDYNNTDQVAEYLQAKEAGLINNDAHSSFQLKF